MTVLSRERHAGLRERDRLAGRAWRPALSGTLASLLCLALVPAALAQSPLTATTGTDGSGGATVTVTSSNFFELRFNTRSGGGIDQFFDLVADPGKASDLAGGTPASFTDALFSDELGLGASSYLTAANNSTVTGESGKADLLEATPTRVRVRAEGFFQTGPATAFVGGIKGLGDYTVMPSGRLGLRWTRRNDRRDGGGNPTTFAYTFEQLELLTAPSTWGLYTEGGGVPPSKGINDTFLLARNSALGPTDFLQVRSGTWAARCSNRYTNGGNFLPNYTELYWGEDTSCTLLPTGLTSDFLLYFKPTTLGDLNPANPHLDPEVSARRDDYRFPATLSVTGGTPWHDAAENTAADDFNEAEGAYLLQASPGAGFSSTFQAGALKRHSPFFKIRLWHSLAPPATITFGGAGKTRGTDYQADVKPVSRAHWAPKLLWHCSTETSGCGSPDVGTGGTQNNVTFVAGRYGNAASISSSLNSHVAATGDFNAQEGAVEFWYQPTYDSTDTNKRLLWYRIVPSVEGATTYYYCYVLWKNGASLSFSLRKGTTDQCSADVASSTAATTSYAWRLYDWVHLKAAWARAESSAILRLFLNGTEVRTQTTGSFFAPPSGISQAGSAYFGGCQASCPTGITTTLLINKSAEGLIDEPHLYGALWDGAEATHPLAGGGLQTDPREHLASPARNFELAFAPVDANRRGSYLYLGADSKFLGLNVALARPGSGGAVALLWQFWNGSAWTGFTSPPSESQPGAKSFLADGTIDWQEGDVPGWAPVSVDGGPDLYYVRVRLGNGSPSYTAFPIEKLVKTDILLLQYGSDVASGTTPSVAAPAPAAPVPVDVALVKTGPASASVGSQYSYALTVTAAPTATDVALVDPLPWEVAYVSNDGGASCAYDAPSHSLSCFFPTVDNGFPKVVNVTVTALAPGDPVVNTASVGATEPDGDPTNNTASHPVTILLPPTAAHSFTVTSKNGTNVLEWMNPANAVCMVRWGTTSGYPRTISDGTDLTASCTLGSANAKGTCTHNGSNGLTYYYTLFVDTNGGCTDSFVMTFNRGRPFATTGPVKWAFSTGAFGVGAPTVWASATNPTGGVIVTSNDRGVYSMQRGTAGGTWPAGWTPLALNGVVQARSPFVPAAAAGTGADTIYLGAQDGRVYAVDAAAGGGGALLTSGALGNTVQAAPAGIFQAFGGETNALFVGTRDDGNANKLWSLKPSDLTSWTGATPFFDQGAVVDGKLGPISSMAAVDYANPDSKVCLTTQKVGSYNFFCLDVETGSVSPYGGTGGSIDSSPIFSSVGATRRLYFGDATGQLYSADLTGGSYSDSYGSDGPVKGFVFPDRFRPGSYLYFASSNYVWAYWDDGTLQKVWLKDRLSDRGAISLDGFYPPVVRPSSPVLLTTTGYLYVGATNGRLYEIDVRGWPANPGNCAPGDATSPCGWPVKSVQLGEGVGVVGAPSFDAASNLIYVGTEAGVFYAVQVPLP